MKSLINIIFPLIILFLMTLTTQTQAGSYNIVTFGARPDGKSDSSKAFLAAWDAACASPARSSITVPQGQFMVATTITYSGRGCRSSGITFNIRGTIVAPANFRVLATSGDTWMAFNDVSNVVVSGGVFDARGAQLWACKHSGSGCPSGVTTLRFANSRNIVVSGVTSLNSQLYHIVFNTCKDVKVHGLRVMAPGDSPNTDGIHVQFSTGVTILNSHIATGDDCVSIGPGTNSLWIEGIVCGPGHGVSIGSLGRTYEEAGVQNVTVKSSTFIDTQNGVRIKSWGRPSTGFVRNVHFKDLTMVNAENPIIIDQKYCPGGKGCPGQASGVRVSDVTYENIHGSSASPVAVNFDCSSEYHCSDINLEDVHLTYNNKPATSSCINARGYTIGTVEPNSCL